MLVQGKWKPRRNDSILYEKKMFLDTVLRKYKFIKYDNII